MADSKTIEERLKPWIDEGEYIIALTLIIMFWTGGWVNLLAFESFDPIIFGRYSITFFAILVLYTLGFVFWFWLVFSLDALDRMKRLIAYIQQTLLLFLLCLVGIIVIVGSMFFIDWWATFPLVEANVLMIMLIFILLILFTKPKQDMPMQLWRKITIVLLAVFFLLEVILQVMAFLRILPFDTLSGLTTPYGRIYQSDQGFVNSQTNSNGWYYPEFRLEDDSYRIIINGDSYVAATQISLESHFGQLIETNLENVISSSNYEVIVQGQLGFSTEMYLSPLLYASLWEPLEPNEIIVFLHLANDINVDSLEMGDPVVKYARGVTPYVDLMDFDSWHTNAHITIAGVDAGHPVRTIYSNSLLLNAIGIYFFNQSSPVHPLQTNSSSEDAPFGSASMLFQEPLSEQAVLELDRVALEIEVFADFMAEIDIQVRLVTLPYFPNQFYETYAGTEWDTQIGDYDLLLPDEVLISGAQVNNISYLSVGQWMMNDNLDVATIQSFFFNEGTGYLTENGHQYIAEIMFDCLYAPSAASTNNACQP